MRLAPTLPDLTNQGSRQKIGVTACGSTGECESRQNSACAFLLATYMCTEQVHEEDGDAPCEAS